MTIEDVVFSISDYAQEFIKTYENPKLDQKVIDAIVVDFINYYAGMHCGMDLAMYSTDLRSQKKLSDEGTILQKDIILPTLNFHKKEYNKSGIIESVNLNSHMNECDGKAEADNEEAVKVIEAFINGYMAS